MALATLPAKFLLLQQCSGRLARAAHQGGQDSCPLTACRVKAQLCEHGKVVKQLARERRQICSSIEKSAYQSAMLSPAWRAANHKAGEEGPRERTGW